MRPSASWPGSPRGRRWSRSMPSWSGRRSASVAEDAPQDGKSQEELIEELEAELKKLKISDVLVQTVFTVSSLGFAKLREDDRDLEQVKLAIESMRALVPSLEGAGPAERVGRAEGRARAGGVRRLRPVRRPDVGAWGHVLRPETTHVSAADPYCPELRGLLLETARDLGIPARDGGTVVTIQGPRFSTR